jgi:simple sugar transport system permease protein
VIVAGQIWTDVFWTSVVAGGLLAGLPLMFTALGETISERAGVLNIGLEGMMLLGAYVGFIGAYYTGSVWVGFLAGITLAGGGITSVLQQAQFGSTYPRLDATPTMSIPLLHRLPVLGTSLFEQPPLVYLAFVFVGLLAWIFRRTNVGLNLRAAGEKPEALDTAGVSVVATRSWAVLSTGALAGLGGAYLSVVVAGIFTPFITQGQGFMAIVIAMLGRGRPLWVLLGSFLFGIALSLSDSLQLAGIDISTDVVNMIPFATIIIALMLFARRSYLPPALALSYVRGAR